MATNDKFFRSYLSPPRTPFAASRHNVMPQTLACGCTCTPNTQHRVVQTLCCRACVLCFKHPILMPWLCVQLAPGGHMGRFCVWTQSAFDSLDALYGAPCFPVTKHACTRTSSILSRVALLFPQSACLRCVMKPNPPVRNLSTSCCPTITSFSSARLRAQRSPHYHAKSKDNRNKHQN